MKKIIFVLILLLTFGTVPSVSAGSLYGEERMFTITGYYSPLPNQSFYVTGSYQGDIALNGRGIRGADGTPVFPGMIAAPVTFSFDTKIKVPGLGIGSVHDRGGAIVPKGERSLARHDRLDVWMGYGEEGLRRALAFGVQHLECEVFEEGAPIDVTMDFNVPPMLNEILSLPERYVFSRNLSRGSRGSDVKKLQEGLHDLGFFAGLVDGIFDTDLERSVFQFQKTNFILEQETDLGAGIFGPRTRAKFSDVLQGESIQKAIQETWEKFHFEEDLLRGQRNPAVLKLQQILVEEEFMHVLPTGFFGPKTEEALTKFQIAYGVIKTKTSQGAGKVGPETREKLNTILKKRKETLKAEKERVLAYKKTKRQFQVLTGKVGDSYLTQK